MGQMDTMRKAIRLDSVAVAEEFYNGTPGVLRGEGQVEDFMDHYLTTPAPERTLNTYSLVALFLSLCIGITAGVLNDVITGVRLFGASLLVAVPATAYIAVSRPMAILERRMHKFGIVLLCRFDNKTSLSHRIEAFRSPPNAKTNARSLSRLRALLTASRVN
jgi:hypothetical protein